MALIQRPGLYEASFQGLHVEEEGLNPAKGQRVFKSCSISKPICFFVILLFLISFLFVAFVTSLQHWLLPHNRQKECQRGEEQQIMIHDCVCLWLWVKEKMINTFQGEIIERHQALFDGGHLDNETIISGLKVF